MRNPSTRLLSLIPMFLAARHDLSPKTERSYRDQFAQFSAWCERRPKPSSRPAALSDLEPGTADGFLGHRMKHGIRPGTPGSEHQAAKAAIALKSLATFLAARRIWHDEFGQSVLDPVLIPQSDAERKRLSEEDFARVLVAVEESPFAQRDRTILFLIAGNGPREKELVGLQLQHYDRADGIIRIPARGTKGRRGQRKERELELDEVVRPEVDLYLDQYRIGADDPEASLFTTRSGTPFTENGLYQIFKRLKRQTGVTALCPHALRHYWAEHFDGDLLELKREGGWNSWALVERYRHHTRRTKRQSTLASALALQSQRMSPRKISGLRVVAHPNHKAAG